jgi:hypothetical protein
MLLFPPFMEQAHAAVSLVFEIFTVKKRTGEWNANILNKGDYNGLNN